MIDLRDQHDIRAEEGEPRDNACLGISGVSAPFGEEGRAPRSPQGPEEHQQADGLWHLRPVGSDETHGGETEEDGAHDR